MYKYAFSIRLNGLIKVNAVPIRIKTILVGSTEIGFKKKY